MAASYHNEMKGKTYTEQLGQPKTNCETASLLGYSCVNVAKPRILQLHTQTDKHRILSLGRRWEGGNNNT
jgi:hypothetical protein